MNSYTKIRNFFLKNWDFLNKISFKGEMAKQRKRFLINYLKNWGTSFALQMVTDYVTNTSKIEF